MNRTHRPRLVPAVYAVALVALLAAAPDNQPPPRVFQYNGADLADAKARIAAGDKRLSKIVQKIITEADKALEAGPFSVVFNDSIPPSGDKHDYMSLSPYWWPDPNKPDGKPYIRRDGEINPERSKYDLEPLENMCSTVETLALAYYFSGQQKYADKAAELLRVWFFDPETRMNPNLKYAQFRPGYDDLRPAGIIEGNRLRKVVDADGLLAGSQAWTADDSQKLKAWFRQLLTYLLESEQGRGEAAAENNHGTWYAVQTATYALYLGENELAKELMIKFGRDRIARQIQPDGSQPYELERTRAFDYSRYALLGHVELAAMGERVGLDLWNYQTEDGRSIRKALEWLMPYGIGEKPWQHQQITPRKSQEFATLLRRAANGFREPRYEQLISRIPDIKGVGEKTDLLFPARSVQ